MNGTEIFLRPHANTIILIGELGASRRIEIEATNAPIDSHMPLQTSLIRLRNAVTRYLCDPDAPGTWKRWPTGYHRQYDWIALAKTSVNIHCNNWICDALIYIYIYRLGAEHKHIHIFGLTVITM